MSAATLPPKVPESLKKGLPRYDQGGQTSPEAQFVKQMYPYAKAWSEKTGIPPQVFVAIGASETNWGRAGGFFGIKGPSPSGRSRNYATWEMVNGKPVQTTDDFAVYDDPNEAFLHFTNLITSGRYAPAWQQFQQTKDWQGLLRGLNNAGYATDPQWWQKIGSLSNTVLKYATDTGATATPAAKATAGASAPSTPAGQAGYRTNVDPTLLKQYTDALAELARLQGERAKPGITAIAQMGIDEAIASQVKIISALQPMVKPAATESAAQQALAASQTAQNYAGAAATTAGIGIAAQNAAANAQNAASTYAGTMAGIVKGMGDLIHTGFADDAVAAEYMRNVVNDAFNQAKGRYDAALQKGQLDLNGYAAVVTATATAQAAEAAYALQALKNANYISDENWKRAQMLLPAGTHYQPGFAPNSPMNQALKQLGLGQMVIETTPLPEGWNDPETNLTKGVWANERMGYVNPAQAFTGPIAGLQGTVDANKAMPALSFAPPAGFNLQPLTPRNYDDVMAQYKDVVAQFTGGAYIPTVPTLPAVPTGDLPGGPDSTDDTTGVPPTAAPSPDASTVRTNLDPKGYGTLPAAPAGMGVTFNPATNQLGAAPASARMPTGPSSFVSANPNVYPPGVIAPDPNRKPADEWEMGPNGEIVPKGFRGVNLGSTGNAGPDGWEPDPKDPSRWQVNRATGSRRRTPGT